METSNANNSVHSKNLNSISSECKSIITCRKIEESVPIKSNSSEKSESTLTSFVDTTSMLTVNSSSRCSTEGNSEPISVSKCNCISF